MNSAYGTGNEAAIAGTEILGVQPALRGAGEGWVQQGSRKLAVKCNCGISPLARKR